MAIHHATRKRAEANGIVLVEDNGQTTANWPEFGRTLQSEDPKTALDAMLLWKKLEANFPGAATVVVAGEDVAVVVGEEDCNVSDEVVSLEDAYAKACDELGEALEANSEQQDDKEKGGDVIGAGYKAKYAERGDVRNCGDWFAKTILNLCGEGWNDAYKALLRENGIEYAKWETGSRGWQGRARMNSGNVLRAKVRKSGFLLAPGVEPIPMPK